MPRLLIALVLPVSGFALARGLRRGNGWAVLLGAAGLLFLVLGLAILEAASATVSTVIGSLMISLAHILNWRGHHHTG